MAEPFDISTLHLWTGAATASGSALAYVQQARFAPAWGWRGDPSLSGSVREHLTGQRADFAFEGVFTLEAAQTLARLAQSATAVHVKYTHSSLDGSAGYVAYSGRIDALACLSDVNGAAYTLSAHSYQWSAF